MAINQWNFFPNVKAAKQKRLRIYPKWNIVCFPFLPFPFLPVDLLVSPLSVSVALADNTPPPFEGKLGAPHALGLGVLRLSSQRTVPRVRPAIKVLGFGAVGSAGNDFVSAVIGPPVDVAVMARRAAGPLDTGVREGVGRGEAEAHAAVEPLVLARVEERGGKGFPDDILSGKTFVLPTAARED